MDSAILSGGPADRSMTWSLRSARLMGWASFGLAAAFFAAPGRIARTFGLEGKQNLIRAFGGQEVMAGMGALSTEPEMAMWARSGGDVIHIATLATGLRTGDERQRRNVGWGLAALAGFFAVDSLIAARLRAERSRGEDEHDDYSDRSGFPNGVPRRDPGQAAASDAFATPAQERVLEPA